ncbi:uncharacterized protein [Anabrus simplex]|uniref:uncharacterized protein n=1 Tax=Anabrus simplex TaxID=316456 RepID=UPI0035A2B81B
MYATQLPLLLLLAMPVIWTLDQDRTPAASSSLAKFVLMFSRPGAFNKTHSIFGEELVSEVTSCPPGESGLLCRQREAQRVVDDCPGGDCGSCLTCEEVSEWPRCCQHNSLCCSNLALACQACNTTELQTFCNKHFKRCF